MGKIFKENMNFFIFQNNISKSWKSFFLSGQLQKTNLCIDYLTGDSGEVYLTCINCILMHSIKCLKI